MDNEADGAREYERLRGELADFVLDALAERIASGEQPQLAQAIADAIDRRVEQAVAARIGEAQFPDPDTFADHVIAAASARGIAEGEAPRPRTRSDAAPARRPSSRLDVRSWSPLQIILIVAIGIAVIATVTFVILNRSSTTGSVRMTANGISTANEATPDGSTNIQTPPPANLTAPEPPARNESHRR